jgi:uncharacterized heparinase superfamily protein
MNMDVCGSRTQMNRERVLGAAEKARRIGPRPLLLMQYLTHRVLRGAGQRRLRANYERLVATPRASATLLLPPVNLPSSPELPQELAEPAARLTAEAEQILAHKVDLLGSGLVSLGDEIDWHADFKSGYRWAPAFYADVEVTRLDDASDAKVPWELSRGHHLLTLARASRLAGDDRFVLELERQFSSWLDANPPGYGINWTNPMEVAIRAVNWIWALRTLDGRRPLDPSLLARISASLQAHAHHVARNLEGSPDLRSNHYLADLLGLFVSGATVTGDARLDRQARHARRELERQIRAQVHPDGVGFEASLPYHALSLEMFLVARIAAEWTGAPFSGHYDSRLRRMLAATQALRHPDGRLPQIGDADSGRILPASFERRPSADQLLWLGAAVLGGARPLAGPPHEEVAWTLGVDAWQRARNLPAPSQARSAAFPLGGFYVLRGVRAQAVIRCGDVGQNGNGGHSHNDACSFELSYGRPFVIDSGTYVYTSDPVARNDFRSTKAHNTVVVAGSEINPLAAQGLFSLRQVARPKLEEWQDTVDSLRLVVSHDGYRRLEPPVVHRRTFELDRSIDRLSVADELLGSGAQEATALLHLAPGVTVDRVDADRYTLRSGNEEVTLAFSGPLSIEVSEGWVSDRYGSRTRASLISASVAGELPLRFGFAFAPAEVAALAPVEASTAEAGR